MTASETSLQATRIGSARALAERHWAVVAICGTIALLHIIGWATILFAVVPAHLSIGATAFGINVATTTYVLGVRHAFDADHIAAIDNSTRKLIAEGKGAQSVGFWFALGHSSIVLLLTALLAFGVPSLAKAVLSPDSSLHQVTSVFGTLFSSGFLYSMAILNASAIVGLWRNLRRLEDRPGEAVSSENAQAWGLLARLLLPLLRMVSRPFHMYFVGLLFGLGFDTVTEITLLTLSGEGASSGLPWYAVMCLPVLFAASMCLFDTLNSTFMRSLYGWSIGQPRRRTTYNIAATLVSSIVAISVATIQFASLADDRGWLGGELWKAIADVDLTYAGYAIVIAFSAFWAILLLFALVLQKRRSPSMDEL